MSIVIPRRQAFVVALRLACRGCQEGGRVPVEPIASPWLDALMLLDQLSVAMTAAIADAVGEAGASNQGVQVLYWLTDEPRLSQATVIERLAADAGQVSRLLTTLERRGLVQREPDPAHRRARRLYLTRRGRAAIRRYEDAMTAALLAQADRIRALLTLLDAPAEPTGPTPARVVVEHMAVAGQRFTAGMAPNAVKHGFGGPKNGRVLRVIARRGEVRPTDIAEELGVALPRVSQATAVLEHRGLVVRSHPAGGDRRRVVLALTPPGRTAILDTIEAFRQHAHVVIAPFVEALWVEPASTAADARALSRPRGVVAG
jgi:DNA-binding MarR family transcriptional regulator